ncbi:hypothetical protein RSOLAG1IB_09739 [Rhizoctonia solani AG-1 IB]|uniref:Transmembrane protein n=1 Tax=Thanatephorus cucumeris (strain AG1-IB / isolate 7/3/14) TaxID=1108050 RepID=A0A0B7FWK9_THACB|nr:hypothetical protein RSOLAG1IB_09739 [Rhizoctonia solani AG-1 IB]
MSSLPPRPLTGEAQSAPRRLQSLARRDPQLYPLAGIVLLTVGVAGYFLSSRSTGADTGHAQPMMPSKLKEEVEKHEASRAPRKTS